MSLFWAILQLEIIGVYKRQFTYHICVKRILLLVCMCTSCVFSVLSAAYGSWFTHQAENYCSCRTVLSWSLFLIEHKTVKFNICYTSDNQGCIKMHLNTGTTYKYNY